MARGPTDDQSKVLEDLGIDPGDYANMAREYVTQMLTGILGSQRRHSDTTKRKDWYKQERLRVIREKGLTEGMRVLVYGKRTTIREITLDGYIIVATRRKVAPQSVFLT